MQNMERRYTALGIAMAVVLGVFILGYRALISDADTPAWVTNGQANHHPKTAASSD